MTGFVRKLFAGALGMLVTIVIFAIVALSLLLGTERGGQWLITQAASFIPGEVFVENQGGTILSGLMAGRVVYRNQALVVELTDVRVNLQAAGLLRNRIVIEHSTAATLSIDELQLIDIGLDGYVGLRDGFPLAGSLHWTEGDSQISGSGNFSGDVGKLEFSQRVAFPAIADINGVVYNVLAQPSIDATASFAELPLAIGEGQTNFRDGHVTVTGTAEAFRINAITDVQTGEFAPVAIDIEVFGNTDRLTIETAGMKVLDGGIIATGSIDLQDGMTAALKLVGENLNPGILQAGMEGRIDFLAYVAVGPDAVVTIDLDTVSGELLAKPVEGTGSIGLRDGRIERVELAAGSGRNRLKLSAGAVPELHGEISLSAPELAALWPGLSGALEGRARFSGSLDSPVVTAQVDGTQVRFNEFSLDRVWLDGRVAADGRLDWTLHAAEVRSGELSGGNLQLRASGSMDEHRLAARLSGGAVDVQVNTRGKWDGTRLEELIESAVIDGGAAGSWVLSEAVLAGLEAGNWSVDAHCWSNAPARICTEGLSRRGGRLIANATLRSFPLATFDPWLVGDIMISGEADADLTVDWLKGSLLNAGVLWRQGETRLSVPGDASGLQDTMATTLNNVRFSLTVNNNVATIEGYAAGDYGMTMRASASLDDPLGEGGQLVGRVDAQVPDIGELRPIINRFLLTSSLGGELAVGADISGTLLEPVIMGRVDLRDGSAGIEVSGIELTDLNVSLFDQRIEEGSSALTVEGSARSGEGMAKIAGELDWSEERGIFSNLRLSGNDFEVLRLPDQRIVVAPDIVLSLDDNIMAISGQLLVPEARFFVQELGRSAVAVSKDVIVHDEQQPGQRRALGPKLVGSLDLQLGENVSFSGFGIETRLSGGLQLVETVDSPLAAEGSLQLVDGRYEMFGKVLTIEQGSLNFYGPLNDPVLDARAARRVRYQGQNIRVGVIVSGRISRQLDFLLFSDPAHSDADILSYLLTGRPASSKQGEGSAISGAAVSLGLQSLTVMEEVSQGLKLDEVGLEGVGDDDTAVVAGKQIGEDIYVRYAYGLFNRIGTFIISYDIGRGFSIEAGSGEQQTLDLLYSIDR